MHKSEKSQYIKTMSYNTWKGFEYSNYTFILWKSESVSADSIFTIDLISN